MGMYTELHLNLELKNSSKIIPTLKYMVGDKDFSNSLNSIDLTHPLFYSERWSSMLRLGSFHFPFKTNSSITFNTISNSYYLNVKSGFKNSQEIRLFLDWICPYINTSGFLGFYRYEENDFPTLIFKEDEKISEKVWTSAVTVKEHSFKNILPMEMIPIPSGKFLMGSSSSNHTSEHPQHYVEVQSFLMSKYTVTQSQWRIVAGWEQVNRELEANPSRFEGDDLPVERVSWYDAVEFCARLSARTGRTYRLPTEAEWEYACRAGTETPFYFGETLTPELANYNSKKTTPVGQFPANTFGLHDMHGNVWEWCADDWHENYKGAPADGSAWLADDERELSKVLRGGSWVSYPHFCYSAIRNGNSPEYRDSYFGFRVVCVSLTSQ